VKEIPQNQGGQLAGDFCGRRSKNLQEKDLGKGTARSAAVLCGDS
jgi:hypothetical protein